MTFILIMLAVLAGLTLLLTVSPRQRTTAVAAVIVGGAIALSDAAPTVGGDAYAQGGCSWDGTTLTCPRLYHRGYMPGWPVPVHLGQIYQGPVAIGPGAWAVNVITYPSRKLGDALERLPEIGCDTAAIVTGTGVAASLARRTPATATIVAGVAALAAIHCE